MAGWQLEGFSAAQEQVPGVKAIHAKLLPRLQVKAVHAARDSWHFLLFHDQKGLPYDLERSPPNLFRQAQFVRQEQHVQWAPHARRFPRGCSKESRHWDENTEHSNARKTVKRTLLDQRPEGDDRSWIGKSLRKYRCGSYCMRDAPDTMHCRTASKQAHCSPQYSYHSTWDANDLRAADIHADACLASNKSPMSKLDKHDNLRCNQLPKTYLPH
jgi:hypothetical protein